MYNVHVQQKVPIKDLYGINVLAVKPGDIVRLTAEVPGVGRLQPQLLMRTNCPAHPLINLMTGELLSELVDDMKFTRILDVESILLERIPDAELTDI